MKRKLSRFLACCLLAMLFLLPQRAEAAGASFSGSSSLRPGDKVTVTFSVSGSNIVAIQGTLSYDSSLELTGTSRLLSDPWAMDMNGSTVVLYDNSLTHAISNASVFSATFRVKSSVAPGTTVSASVKNITVSDGSSDTSLGNASWSATIAAPLSSNASLSSLSCSSGTLSPSFSSGTTSYSVTVPYDVTSLSLSYKTQDSGARVSVSGNSLSVGSNTVTLTVTAANGNTKYYVIYATRQQDPNYVPSSNALLSSITSTKGTLSPVFTPEGKDYVLYVPYEVQKIEVGGVAQDGKARSVTGSSAELEPGDNVLTVVCVAEDGKTKEEYTVHVYRMPVYEGILPEITGGEPADYTAVDMALAKVPADLTGYTDESVQALQKAIDAVVADYPAEKQAQVDDMAKAITDAVAALEEKAEEKPDPVEEPAQESASAPWQRLLAVGEETVMLPYVGELTGPLPLWVLAAVALALLVLLAYLIGTLIGRAVGKRRTLRRLQREQEAAQMDGGVAPIAADAAGDETWELPAEAAAAAAVTEAAENDAEPVSGTVTAEVPVVEEPVPETVEAEAPVVEESASDTVEAEAPVIEDPVPETVEVEAPVIEEPVPETVEAEAPVIEEPAPKTVEAEAPVIEEPVPETVEAETPAPQAPASNDIDESVRHMSLDELLDDIRNM